MRVSAINNYYVNRTQVKNNSGTPKTVQFGASPSIEQIYRRMAIEINNMLYGHRPFGFHSPEGYCKVLENFEFNDLMSLQGESAVFSMKNPHEVLKISCAPYEQYIPEFHAPEISRGVITTSKSYPVINLLRKISVNKFYWVKQVKGEMPVGRQDMLDLVKRVEAAGYETHDIKYDQFAYFNGEAKFIDLGCITKKGEYCDYLQKSYFAKRT